MDQRQTSLLDGATSFAPWSAGPAQVPHQNATPSRPAATRLRPGTSVGPYRLIEPAGAGGMAEVWRAYDARLQRYVAIKFLSPRYATDPAYLERFLHEARAVSRFDHPNVLTVLDYGEQDGWTYMVSPFIGGGTLAERLHRGPWTVHEAVAVLAPLAAALDYAHREGVVHRDVKPSNVLFTDRGRLVLSDFGIAQMLEGSAVMSEAGRIVGTPMYMSPEQADGRPASPLSDLYSLGVIAYQMLTGRPPFAAETPLALLYAHLDAPLPPPSSVNPTIQPAVEAALFKVMAKDPADRFATGRELIEALRVPLHPRPPLPLRPAPPLPPPTRGGPMFKHLFAFAHQRSILQAVAFYLVFLAVGFGVMLPAIAIVNLLVPDSQTFDYGVKIGIATATLFPPLLSFLLIWKKRRLASPLYLLAILAASVVGYAVGMFVAILVPAFLSTRPLRRG